MIQIEVQKNKILKEDIEFGVGAVTQTRGTSTFNGNKVNVAEMPYSLTQTFGQIVTEIQTQYDYIIANVVSDPSAVPMTNLIRKNGNDLVDNLGAVFTPQVIDSGSNLEGSYVKKLWVKIISSTEHHLKRGTAIIAKFNPVTGAQIFSFDYSAIAAALGLGTAAFLDHGTDANEIVKLDGTGKLPAVDGSLLTNLPIPTSSVPIGMPMLWLLATPPVNYLVCDGSAVSRTTYAALFAVIGTAFGIGDGTTTFQLPDPRAEFLRFWDNGRGIDTGRALGSYQAQAMPEHSHGAGSLATNSAGAHTHLVTTRHGSSSSSITAINTDTQAMSPQQYSSTSSAGSHNHTLSGTTADAGSGSENRPRNFTMNMIIRYQ